ncbi:MAG: hypothetical protein ACPG8W_18660 [Candidatus Promineifilaceae bacterium]
MQNRLSLLTILIFLLISQASCGLVSGAAALIGTPTPQPTLTPLGNTLNFAIMSSNYETVLAPGQRVPGTQLQFVGKSDNVYTVSIDGVMGGIQDGNSFNWKGIIGPGATADYRLKLLPTFTDTELKANGDVLITLFDPNPVESVLPQVADTGLVYAKMPIDYVVPIGRQIPGTSLIYTGDDNGAHTFSGTELLNRFFIGDSILWNGFLRDNIYIQNNLELKSVEENGLQVVGTVTLRVFSAPVIAAEQ